MQPLSNTFVFLSVVLQQKIASEIYFYINFFKQKFSSFDKPIKRFAFIIPKKQFLYRVLNHGLIQQSDFCRRESAILQPGLPA